MNECHTEYITLTFQFVIKIEFNIPNVNYKIIHKLMIIASRSTIKMFQRYVSSRERARFYVIATSGDNIGADRFVNKPNAINIPVPAS